MVKIFGCPSGNAFVALKSDGSVASWGATQNQQAGNDPGITSGVVDVVCTQKACAALKSDGSIESWGNTAYGGDNEPSDTGFVNIVSSGLAFAALNSDGSVVAWGSDYQGGCDSGTDITDRTCKPSGLSDVVELIGGASAFLVRKSDNTVAVWGYKEGGGCKSGSGTTVYTCMPTGLTDVVGVFSTGIGLNAWGGEAFSVLMSDGSVKAWGKKGQGGDDPEINSGVAHIYSSYRAFLAVGSTSLAYGPEVTGSSGGSV